MAFRWKIAALNLNSQEKFYENGIPAVLKRLAAVPAELPAILQKKRRISKKFRPGFDPRRMLTLISQKTL